MQILLFGQFSSQCDGKEIMIPLPSIACKCLCWPER